jgi:hypothetical protein
VAGIGGDDMEIEREVAVVDTKGRMKGTGREKERKGREERKRKCMVFKNFM